MYSQENAAPMIFVVPIAGSLLMGFAIMNMHHGTHNNSHKSDDDQMMTTNPYYPYTPPYQVYPSE